MKGAALSQERLKECLHYNPETGVFTWLMKLCRNVRVGDVAGCLEENGYVKISIDHKQYRAHRLAWLYVHGTFPPDVIDHVNRVKSDNRISNLRLATNVENGQNQSMRRNNTTGHMGVYWKKQTEKWHAQISIDRKLTHLGYFKDLTEAVAARKAAEIQFHIFQHQPGELKLIA